MSITDLVPIYRYQGRVKRWIDGDTLEADVDLGFTVRVDIVIRLLGIDTPERGRPGFAEATEKAMSLAPIGSQIIVDSKGHDSFGRWLATIWSTSSDSVNTVLLETGYAVPFLR